MIGRTKVLFASAAICVGSPAFADDTVYQEALECAAVTYVMKVNGEQSSRKDDQIIREMIAAMNAGHDFYLPAVRWLANLAAKSESEWSIELANRIIDKSRMTEQSTEQYTQVLEKATECVVNITNLESVS